MVTVVEQAKDMMTRGWVVPALRGLTVMMLLALWRPHSGLQVLVAGIVLATSLLPDRAVARLRARRTERRMMRGESQPRTPTELDYEQGYALLRAGRFEAAVAMLERATAASPRDADVRRHLGEALAALGRHSDAAAVLREAVAIRPRDAAAHARLGASLAVLGEEFVAVRVLREALRLDPRHVEARRTLETLRPAVAASRMSKASGSGRHARSAPSPAA